MQRLKNTETWVFDLDNTLYPADCNLFAQIDDRMGTFIANHLEVDRTQARKIQKKYFVEHGTTLNGLMTIHGLNPHDFLDFVHDIDHSPVTPDHDLKTELNALQGRKIIFTNGSLAHAEKTLDRLGVTEQFSAIYDIVATNFRPKPEEEAYKRVIEAEGLDPRSSAMFEDIPRNLLVPNAVGMSTILVRPRSTHPDEEFGLTGTGNEIHIDHITKDLSSFLKGVNQLNFETDPPGKHTP